MNDGLSLGAYYTRQNYKDVENLAKIATGSAIVPQSEGLLDGAGLMLGFVGVTEGAKILSSGWKNRNDLGAWWNNGIEACKNDYQIKKGLFANGGWRNPSVYKDAWNQHSASTVLERLPKDKKLQYLEEGAQKSENAQKALESYKKAEEAAKLAKANPANARAAITEANAHLAHANNFAHKAAVAGEVKTGFWGKIGRFFGKYTGMSKLNGAVKGLATESPAVAKVLKYGKGNGVMAALMGGVELFTQVIPAYSQLGAASGTKQVVKSTVKTAAGLGGFSAGMAAGTAIGTLIFPGAGSLVGGLVGGLCGMIGGTIGSWAATKAVSPFTKSELEIAKEKEAKDITKQAIKDPAKMQMLVAAAGQKVQENGGQTEDGKIAFTSLNRILKSDSYRQAQATGQNTVLRNKEDADADALRRYQESQYASQNSQNPYAGYASNASAAYPNYSNQGYTNPYANASFYGSPMTGQAGYMNQSVYGNTAMSNPYAQYQMPTFGQQNWMDQDFMTLGGINPRMGYNGIA